MLQVTIGVLLISSGALYAPSDAVEVGVCDGDACSALKSTIGAAEEWRKELGCCTHADCSPGVTTIMCAHDVMTRFLQNTGTSKVCSDFNEQCEALRVGKMNLQLSSNILGCSEREERAFIHAPSASTRKVLEDLLPQSVVAAIHNVLPIPNSLKTGQVEHAVGSANALATGVVLVGGLSNFKGNVYFSAPRTGNGQWGAVCADGFRQLDANAVCVQLGFARAREFYGRTGSGGVRGNQFGPVPDPFAILFGNGAAGPGCVGASVRVQDCANVLTAFPALPARPAAVNCPSGLAAGVECAN